MRFSICVILCLFIAFQNCSSSENEKTKKLLKEINEFENNSKNDKNQSNLELTKESKLYGDVGFYETHEEFIKVCKSIDSLSGINLKNMSSSNWYDYSDRLIFSFELRHEIDSILKTKNVIDLIPENMKFMWSNLILNQYNDFPERYNELYGVKIPESGEALLNCKNIKFVSRSFSYNGEPSLQISFDEKSALIFEKMTEDNIGKSIAITIDEFVYSCPNVREKISGGMVEISPIKSVEESEKLSKLITECSKN